MAEPLPLRFTAAEAYAAHEGWGCNCGPTAIAAVLGLSLDQVRPHLRDFETKRYTNPTLMFQILKELAPDHSILLNRNWPKFGLARIQWEGPWTEPGVPMRARYRHTHWVGVAQRAVDDIGIYDCNAMESGGWISFADWAGTLVPWLLNNLEPEASGRWHVTHSIESRL